MGDTNWYVCVKIADVGFYFFEAGAIFTQGVSELWVVVGGLTKIMIFETMCNKKIICFFVMRGIEDLEAAFWANAVHWDFFTWRLGAIFT